MIVCVDSGNTRVKWAAHDGNAWLAQGAAARARMLDRFAPASVAAGYRERYRALVARVA